MQAGVGDKFRGSGLIKHPTTQPNLVASSLSSSNMKQSFTICLLFVFETASIADGWKNTQFSARTTLGGVRENSTIRCKYWFVSALWTGIDGVSDRRITVSSVWLPDKIIVIRSYSTLANQNPMSLKFDNSRYFTPYDLIAPDWLQVPIDPTRNARVEEIHRLWKEIQFGWLLLVA